MLFRRNGKVYNQWNSAGNLWSHRHCSQGLHQGNYNSSKRDIIIGYGNFVVVYLTKMTYITLIIIKYLVENHGSTGLKAPYVVVNGPLSHHHHDSIVLVLALPVDIGRDAGNISTL